MNKNIIEYLEKELYLKIKSVDESTINTKFITLETCMITIDILETMKERLNLREVYILGIFPALNEVTIVIYEYDA